MSVRQLEFQMAVLRMRLKGAALDVYHAFQKVIERYGRCDGVYNVERLRKAARDLRAQDEAYPYFQDRLLDAVPDLALLAGKAVTAATRLYHHHELQAGNRVAPTLEATHVWFALFEDMVRIMYIEPRMYTTDPDPIPLARSLELIEAGFERFVYGSVPLDWEATPDRAVVGMTAGNLERHRVAAAAEAKAAAPRRTARRAAAPSVVSLASTASSLPRHPQGIEDEDDVRTILSHRQQGAGHRMGRTGMDLGGRLRVEVPAT